MKTKQKYIEQLAAKLYCEGFEAKNLTVDKAKEKIKDCVAPVVLNKLLDNDFEAVKNELQIIEDIMNKICTDER